MSEDGTIDYSKYSRSELLDALGSIHSARYPQNYANLRRALDEAEPEAPSIPESSPNSDNSTEFEDDPLGPYVANQTPLRTRVVIVSLSIAILAYGVYGLAVGEIYIPLRNDAGIQFGGLAAIFVFVAMTATAATLVSVVVDHYDRRDNERTYARFTNVTSTIALLFVWVAIFLQTFRS